MLRRSPGRRGEEPGQGGSGRDSRRCSDSRDEVVEEEPGALGGGGGGGPGLVQVRHSCHVAVEDV